MFKANAFYLEKLMDNCDKEVLDHLVRVTHEAKKAYTQQRQQRDVARRDLHEVLTTWGHALVQAYGVIYDVRDTVTTRDPNDGDILTLRVRSQQDKIPHDGMDILRVVVRGAQNYGVLYHVGAADHAEQRCTLRSLMTWLTGYTARPELLNLLYTLRSQESPGEP